MWPSIGLASTIFASIVRHCAPNAAEPCAVIRSTTWVAGRDGGMTGSGGGGPAGAAGGGAGAAETAEITSGTAISAAHAASAPRSSLRIFLSLAAVWAPEALRPQFLESRFGANLVKARTRSRRGRCARRDGQRAPAAHGSGFRSRPECRAKRKFPHGACSL